MKTPQLIFNYHHAILFIVLLTVLALCSAESYGQTSREAKDNAIRNKVSAWEDSVAKMPSRKHPIYKGFDVSLASPQFTLQSNVDAIKNLRIGFFGGSVGGLLANPVGKLKGSLGLYYSGDNVRYSFDLIEASVALNVYLLRIKNVKYHTVEPYAFAKVDQLRTKLYGTYMQEAPSKNYSISEEPYIGGLNSSQLVFGTGLEFQLENEKRDFIHLYAEASYGRTFQSSVSSQVLSGTSVPNTFWIKLGISMGKFK